MSELDVINKTQQPITKSQLKTLYTDLGIQATDTVCVHTSLSSLGYVIGGAQTVLESLLETLSEGTLLMPSHSGDVSDPAYWENPPVPSPWLKTIRDTMPAFNPETTPTRGVGKVAQQFLSVEGVRRSYHPEASFAAIGKAAHTLTENHPLTPMLGIDSPLGRMHTMGGKVLMLGAPLQTMSALHVSEALSGVVKMESNGAPIIREGKRTWVDYEDYAYDDDDFETIAQTLVYEGILTKHTFHCANVYVGDIAAVITRGSALVERLRTKKA